MLTFRSPAFCEFKAGTPWSRFLRDMTPGRLLLYQIALRIPVPALRETPRSEKRSTARLHDVGCTESRTSAD